MTLSFSTVRTARMQISESEQIQYTMAEFSAGPMPDLNALIEEDPYLPEPDAYGDEFSPSTQQSCASQDANAAFQQQNYNPSGFQVVTNVSSLSNQHHLSLHQKHMMGGFQNYSSSNREGTGNNFNSETTRPHSESSLEVQPSIGSNQTLGTIQETNINSSVLTNVTVNNVSESVDSFVNRKPGFQAELDYYMKTFSEEEFKWTVLKLLDENLDERDILLLKFLCLDKIPGGQLEDITRGFELFDILEKKHYISHKNVIILAELMFRIGRIDMLKLLVKDLPGYQQLVDELPSCISDYRVLLHEIAEDTINDELRLMKFYIDNHFQKAKLDAMEEPQDLFISMEKKQLLGPKNMDILIKMMQQLEKAQMVKKIKIYKGDIFPGNPVPLDHWDGSNSSHTQNNFSNNINMDRGSTSYAKVNNFRENNTHNYEPLQRAVPASAYEGTVADLENIGKIDAHIRYNNLQGMPQVYDIKHYYVDNNPFAEFSRSSENLPEYKMDACPRGYCLIINNKLFDKNTDKARELRPREGSDIDKENLESIFTELDFIVRIYEDLTAQEMVGVVNQYAYKVDHSHFDCFVCCILTHGRKDKVFGSDGILVDILEFTNCFKGIQCNTLRGKPKLFFIQACQGKHKQRGYPTTKTKDLDTDDDPVTIDSMESIPNEADFLISLATVPGFVSYRSKTHGSWFVNALVEALRKYHKKEDLMSILVNVNHEVSAMIAPMEDDEYKQVPAPQVTLRKRIYFR